jgi:hypothetical protein
MRLVKVLSMEGVGEVQLIRQARASRLRISVKSTGAVSVSIPWLFSFSKGEAFLEEKREWVIRTRLRLEKQGLTRKSMVPGPLFSTRNFKYHLSPVKAEAMKVQVRPEEQTVVIGYPEMLSLQNSEVHDKIRHAVEGVLRYEAKRYLPTRTRELATQYGYTCKAITIKNNRTNWGSCSSLKNINLNLHLMRLPDRMIDYIIVHELVHTIIPNHGPFFKAKLKSHFPDSVELDQAIRKFRPGVI